MKTSLPEAIAAHLSRGQAPRRPMVSGLTQNRAGMSRVVCKNIIPWPEGDLGRVCLYSYGKKVMNGHETDGNEALRGGSF